MTVRPVIAVLALGAITPAAALAQTSTQPYTPPSSGMSGGAAWTTVDLGTCSLASGTAVVEPGPAVGCNNSGIQSPGVAVSALGSVWAASTGGYAPGVATTYLQAINPTTSQVAPGQMINGITAPQAGVKGGSYLWLTGASAEAANGKSYAVAVAVDATGTVRKRFRSSVAGPNAMGQGMAYGAGRVWMADSTGRVYALVPSSGKRARTIRTPGPRGLAVSRSTLWVTNPSARTVRVFNTSTGAQRRAFKVIGSPNAVVSAAGSVWVFSQRYLYRYSPKTLKQTGRYRAPLSQSGWLGAASGPGGIWASNYVAQVVRFNTTTRTFDINATWSNGNVAGPLAGAAGALWVPDGGDSPFPVGHAVTRITPTGS